MNLFAVSTEQGLGSIKIHDFVPFGVCHDPVKLFLTYFSNNFEIFDVEIF